MNQSQVDTIQKLLLDFLWQGRACLKMSTIIAPPTQGGLKMLHVKNVLHSLQVKWMQCLSNDLGLSWSRFIWPKLSALYPPELFGGMRDVCESDLHTLPPFYAGMVRSFCWVNNLFYEKNPNLYLSHNLWATVGAPAVYLGWKRSNLLTLMDVPKINGKVDLQGITSKLGPASDSYLIACRIQKQLGNKFQLQPPEWPSHMVYPVLLQQSKQLLQENVSTPLN